jgi:hypothetical protein
MDKAQRNPMWLTPVSCGVPQRVTHLPQTPFLPMIR